jgi:hypothetical protein
MSQGVHNAGRFGDLPSGDITFPGIDASTDAMVTPASNLYLRTDFNELETAWIQESPPRMSWHFYHVHCILTCTRSFVSFQYRSIVIGRCTVGQGHYLPLLYQDPAAPATSQPEFVWPFDDATLTCLTRSNQNLVGLSAPERAWMRPLCKYLLLLHSLLMGATHSPSLIPGTTGSQSARLPSIMGPIMGWTWHRQRHSPCRCWPCRKQSSASDLIEPRTVSATWA